MNVGTIAEAWRYPVKSMAGEQVNDVLLDALGVIGDRCWSMLDADSGDIAWGKRFPSLMDLAAAYAGAVPAARVFGEQVPAVQVRFPDGRVVRSDEDIDQAVSDFAGARLTLSALQAPDNRQHYRWAEPLDEAAIMKILGVAPGEDPPDLSVYDENLVALLAEYFAPPGTYTDMAPVHALTTASLEYMRDVSGEHFDHRRFRPNFLIETAPGVDGLAEFSWVGRTLRAGEALLRVEAKTVRCSMPARGQAQLGLPANPAIAKALYQETGRFMGAYLAVVEPGRVAAGDDVILLD